MNAPQSVHTDHREASANYRGEIYRSGDWRVIVCRDSIQWIIQRRTRARSPHGAKWRGRHYCATRKALARLWAASTGESGTILEAMLPEYFPRATG